MRKATFAERLHDIIRERDIRQVELCKMTSIGKSAMSQYLKGSFTPKQENLYKLASALDVSEAWLMGYDVPCEKKNYDVDSDSRELDFDSFYFTATDDSMASFYIPNGTQVLIQKSNSVRSGQIVCFSVVDDPTIFLRKLYKQGDRIIFTASLCGDYPPLVFCDFDISDGRLKIHGIAVKALIPL